MEWCRVESSGPPLDHPYLQRRPNAQVGQLDGKPPFVNTRLALGRIRGFSRSERAARPRPPEPTSERSRAPRW
jgi:hypothetical protein